MALSVIVPVAIFRWRISGAGVSIVLDGLVGPGAPSRYLAGTTQGGRSLKVRILRGEPATLQTGLPDQSADINPSRAGRLILGAGAPEDNPHDDHPDEEAKAADELDDLKHLAHWTEKGKPSPRNSCEET